MQNFADSMFSVEHSGQIIGLGCVPLAKGVIRLNPKGSGDHGYGLILSHFNAVCRGVLEC